MDTVWIVYGTDWLAFANLIDSMSIKKEGIDSLESAPSWLEVWQ